MLDFRHGISYNETQDPKACNLNETGKWREMSRDPARKSNRSEHFIFRYLFSRTFLTRRYANAMGRFKMGRIQPR